MTHEQLKEKALSLPYLPGVYIMRDKTDKVIYVGKAKKLKNRVSQYFQDTASHTPKTRLMVSKIHHFDVIVAGSEFEALVLECSLIKQHMPKYNILLKDDKGYPYVRLDRKSEYPSITLSTRVANDGAEYFGPYGSRGATQSLIQTIYNLFKLPTCSKRFPRDIGKDRPCLNYHMNQCDGWCQPNMSAEEYWSRISQARQLLKGDFSAVADALRDKMIQAAEELDFELAASLRDRLNAVETLGKKQLVTAGASAETDVIGYAQTEAKACLAVLHYSGGNLLDKEYEVFSIPDDAVSAVSSLIKQFYLSRGNAPKRVLLPFEIEDAELFSRLLLEKFSCKCQFIVPQRGDNVKLVALANKNSQEEAERLTKKDERISATMHLLGRMLTIEPPKRIESFDISNISGTDIVAGMVVFVDGKPKKADYKRFKIEGLAGQDDYSSMEQVVRRRFQHYLAGDKGFDEMPSMLLIDGGINHANVALQVLGSLELDIPVFGMVKDHRHRTRALVTPHGDEIRIDNQQSVFSFIGNIQEETHRFAISYHRQLRSKRLRYSELDGIPGIGSKRKQELLRTFKSLTMIRNASLDQLQNVLPADAALSVYMHFHPNEEKTE